MNSGLYRDSMELHEFFMQVPMPLVVLSGPEHIFTLTNKSYEKLHNKNVIGKTFLQAFTENEIVDFIPFLDRVYNTGIPYIGSEIFFPMKNTEGVTIDHWLSVEYHPFYGNSGKITGILGFVNDMTEVVLARNVIEKSASYFQHLSVQLEAESEVKEVFVSTLTHDLRTPLTIAKLSAMTLEKKLEDNPELKKLASRISSTMNRADGMIQDLLDASYIKSGNKFPLKISPCSMNTIINSVVEELSSIYKNRFKVESIGKITGFWDALSIQRVLENLLLNAIKYGKDKAVITIHLTAISDFVSLQVHNEGPLIPPEKLKTLFDRFKRLECDQAGEQKGWGLGLTLVKGIIEAHGGNVQVKSIEDEGTTFSITIPLNSSEFRKTE